MKKGLHIICSLPEDIHLDKNDAAPVYPKTPPFGDPDIDMPAIEAETKEMVLVESLLQAEERIAELEAEIATLKGRIPPYSREDYLDALSKELDLDDWNDYRQYYGLGETPEEG